MILFYARHGDPIYKPDSLTPLGKRQAEALGKRLALFGLNRIYSSPSRRALETALPTSEITGLPIAELPFLHEDRAWEYFTFPDPTPSRWLCAHERARALFVSEELLSLGDRWYDHPAFSDGRAREGVLKMRRDADAFLFELGFRHIGRGAYEATRENDERIVLFAHHGAGMSFLSTLLDIPYPIFSTRFDLCHSGLTAIELKPRGGIVIPRVLTLSSDAHLYREGLPSGFPPDVRF